MWRISCQTAHIYTSNTHLSNRCTHFKALKRFGFGLVSSGGGGVAGGAGRHLLGVRREPWRGSARIIFRLCLPPQIPPNLKRPFPLRDPISAIAVAATLTPSPQNSSSGSATSSPQNSSGDSLYAISAEYIYLTRVVDSVRLLVFPCQVLHLNSAITPTQETASIPLFLSGGLYLNFANAYILNRSINSATASTQNRNLNSP